MRWTAAALLLLLACGDDDDDGVDGSTPSIDAAPPDGGSQVPDAAPTADAGPPPLVFGGDRPATLQVPTTYDPAVPTPLVVVLHGYAPTNSYAVGLLGFADLFEQENFLMIAPSGTKNPSNNYFWNATDACCNFYGAEVDDVAYLTGLVDDISAAYNVDAKRVFVVGHSNGGFMAYRLACEAADKIAAVVSVAGATYATAGDCAPSRPVSVLQVHGTADDTILYAGGGFDGGGPGYPSAEQTTSLWAGYDGCGGTSTAGAALDVIGGEVAETSVSRRDGCPAGGAVELWTVAEGPHVLFFKPGPPLLWDWLAAHARP
jgi:polyhydroxybutyrate depolymerase